MTEKIRSHLATVAYREGWDRIFGNKEKCSTCRWYAWSVYYERCLYATDDEPCGNYERKTNND